MEKININLYGGKGLFGGRETPLEAEITYCDNYKECSFYKNGKCFNAGRWKPNCKIGKKSIDVGYTSRAKKYYSFRKKYESDDKYNKLEEPRDIVGKVGDNFVLNLGYLKELEGGKYIIETQLFNNELIYIPEKLFTNDLIKMILEGNPKIIFGYQPIKSYKEEILPRFLYELKTNFKSIYDRFTNEFPEYKDFNMNYIGRYAYIYSLKNGSELKDCHNNIWKIENNEIVCYKWKTWLPFKGSPTETRIKITSDMKYQITDNSQVDENTKFAD